MKQEYEHYYVPDQSPWPIVGAVALFFIAVGAALTVMSAGKEGGSGIYILYAGIAVLLYMLFSWFKNVIDEVNKIKVLISGRPCHPIAWVVSPPGVVINGHTASNVGQSTSLVMALLSAPPSQGTESIRA